LISKLVSPNGTILIPGINDQVAELTAEEKEMYSNLDFNMKDFHDSIGSKNTIFSGESETLLHRWRYPSLSFHGVEGTSIGSN
jgi:Cys-Gly metallodipeptidase DUG1